MSVDVEWAVMRRGDSEPWRGPWPEAIARQWVREVEEEGIRPGAFFVARRTVTPWEPVA